MQIEVVMQRLNERFAQLVPRAFRAARIALLELMFNRRLAISRFARVVSGKVSHSRRSHCLQQTRARDDNQRGDNHDQQLE